MMHDPHWWQLAPENPPEARWLGLIRRRFQAKEERPKQVSVPFGRIRQPRTRAVSLDPLSDSQHFYLAPEFELGEPRTDFRAPLSLKAANLIRGEEAGANAQGGTVNLAGVRLNDVPPPPRWPREGKDRVGIDGLEPPPVPHMPLAKRLAYLLQPPVDLALAATGPLQWPSTLYGYQIDGIRALLDREAVLLADDMGLGKTIQAIAALRILFLHRKIDSCLVVVPAGLVSQWRKEFREWGPELRISVVRGLVGERAWQWRSECHVHLTSYETLRADFTNHPYAPPHRQWGVVVLDEAQKIKNGEAEVSRKCKQLPRHRAWALTGTPLENRIEDLVSILEFVDPLEKGATPKKLRLQSALELHKSLQLRRKKAEVLDQLPPKTVSEIILPLAPQQKASYDRAEREGIIHLRESGEALRIEHVLALITRLKQICNFCPTTGESAKFDDLQERLEGLQVEGHRALVFSQFSDEKYGVRSIVKSLAGLKPLTYTGDLSLSGRDAAIAEFKSNPDRKVLVLSVRAGGQGLNLQDASYVFHFDRWWNPAVENQATDRVHRLGQTRAVHVYKYVLEGTIEEKIDKILKEKQSLFDRFVDDISIDLPSKLTAEELFGLFGLSPPAGIGSRRPASEAMRVNYAVMSGTEFEAHLKTMLESRGWKVEMTPPTRDGGIDLIARRQDEIGVELTLYIQCKNHVSPVGVEVVRALNGVLPSQKSGVVGVVVCPSGFSVDAKAFARSQKIHLWDRDALSQLMSNPQ